MDETLTQRSKPGSFSLYDKHKKIIVDHQKVNKIRTEAAALQDIIEQYQKLKYKGVKRDAVIFILYPIIICVFSLFCTLSINNIIKISVNEGFVFVSELKLLQGVFNAIGFITVGILAMCMIFFFHNMYNRGIYG